jgi:hypothetical protein
LSQTIRFEKPNKTVIVNKSGPSNPVENDTKENKILKIGHTSSGFFACCSIKLIEILKFKREHHIIPDTVDSSNLWDLYKPDNLQDDITYHFFIDDKKINSIGGNFTRLTPDFDYGTQYRCYKEYKYRDLSAYITKYFSPSKNILHIETKLLRKYDIDTDRYCAIYYRGTDKVLETQLGSFESFNDKVNEIILQNKATKILIQTDSTMFLEYMKTKHFDILAFNESVTSLSNLGTHNENSPTFNYMAVKYLFATALIISKCKYIVCSSGNVASWIMQYRGNGDNVHQFSTDKWM